MRAPYDNIHYDIRDMLSRNCIVNLICSLRGLGKTYTFKDYAIDDALKDEKKKFIYLRRYRTEFNRIDTFFNDIQNIYPEVELKVRGGERGGYFVADNRTIGYFFPLSSQAYFKSVPLQDCNKMIFDEAFLAQRGFVRYLKNEVMDLMDIVETANRLRVNEDGTQKKLSEQLRLFILGNSFSTVNPYFNSFKITPDLEERYSFSRDPRLQGKVLLDLCTNEEFKRLKYESTWGQIFDAVGYGEHSIENKFFEDIPNMIGWNNKLQQCMELTDGQRSIFIYPDYKNLSCYCSITKGQVFATYNCSALHLNEGERYIKTYRGSKNLMLYYDWLSAGHMYFKDTISKDVALTLFAKVGMGSR